MYDNQMSVFSKQMDCEPKLADCGKRSDSMKLQVLMLSAAAFLPTLLCNGFTCTSPLLLLSTKPNFTSVCIVYCFIGVVQLVKWAELEGKLSAAEGRRGMDRYFFHNRGLPFHFIGMKR